MTVWWSQFSTADVIWSLDGAGQQTNQTESAGEAE